MSDYENTYCETEFSGHATRVEPSCRALPRPPTANVAVRGSEPPINKKPRRGLIIAVAVVATSIVGLLVALLVHNVNFHVFSSKQQSPEQKNLNLTNNGQSGVKVQYTTVTNKPPVIVRPTLKLQTESSGAQSCLDLKTQGINDDGIYVVRPDDNFVQSQTYCDMTTDGGGWTLVASINENDIKRKCYPDDHWSVYQHASTNDFPAKSNWENKQIFGDVRRSTTADFKHVGFFAMNASDVMVWHVTNGLVPPLWKEGSALRYRTNNKFLQSNGGSIGVMYKDKYPLAVSSKYELDFTEKVLDALTSKGTDITKIFSKFYNYAYSQTSSYTNAIPNTFMYRSSNYGNRISFNAPGCSFSEVVYGNDHKCPKELTTFGTRKSQPFFAAVAILNTFKETSYYYIYLNSERSFSWRSSEETILQNTTMTKGNLKLHYEIVQSRYSSYVTIGEFYFIVSNVKDWGSVEPTTFSRTYSYKSSYYRRNRYQVDGSPVNIILGYTLLTISSGGSITQDQANKVGEEILNAIAPLKTLFGGNGPAGLSTPVVFDKGSVEEVKTMVPPSMRAFVQPGFLQFRAYNASGYPTAFCPGIKVSSINPEYACIGAISNWLGDHGTCGDYAGWEGGPNDDIQINDASGFAHSHKDIYSTILIFQR